MTVLYVDLYENGELIMRCRICSPEVCPPGLETDGNLCRKLCPADQVRDTATGKCCPVGQTVNVLGNCGPIVTCPPNMVSNGVTCVCAPGFVSVLVEGVEKCVPVCPPCQERDAAGGCSAIDPLKVFNPVTGLCEVPCPVGQTRASSGQCCPVGSISITGACICPPGLVTFGTSCVTPCPPGKIFDSLGNCVDAPGMRILFEDTPIIIPIK